MRSAGVMREAYHIFLPDAMHRLIWMENGKPVRCTAGRLTAVEAEAFEGIAAAAVEIPEGVTEIGDRAFQYCQGLMEVVIPATVKSIGKGAFRHCENLGGCRAGDGCGGDRR